VHIGEATFLSILPRIDRRSASLCQWRV